MPLFLIFVLGCIVGGLISFLFKVAKYVEKTADFIYEPKKLPEVNYFKNEIPDDMQFPVNIINTLMHKIHSNAVQKGFWDTERHLGLLLMLVNTELCEALEADRNGAFRAGKIQEVLCSVPFDKTICYRDDDLTKFIDLFDKNIRGSIDEEIADAIIRLLDICGGYKIDIGLMIILKMEYNKTRAFMHCKKY